ncbi:MAG: hypothetical protein HYT73_01400 [Candidatus Aenigmarchaeota archaeon]|nr:hypothetical protein [Candidatus Aenigmarchaeota archaeon]
MTEIKSLENDKKRIKLLHSLGKIPFEQSKKEIRILDSRLKVLMDSLPEKERSMLLFRKEYHSVHY